MFQPDVASECMLIVGKTPFFLLSVGISAGFMYRLKGQHFKKKAGPPELSPPKNGRRELRGARGRGPRGRTEGRYGRRTRPSAVRGATSRPCPRVPRGRPPWAGGISPFIKGTAPPHSTGDSPCRALILASPYCPSSLSPLNREVSGIPKRHWYSSGNEVQADNDGGQ